MKHPEVLRGKVLHKPMKLPVNVINQDQLSDEQKLQQWKAYKLTDRYVVDMIVSYGRVGL